MTRWTSDRGAVYENAEIVKYAKNENIYFTFACKTPEQYQSVRAWALVENMDVGAYLVYGEGWKEMQHVHKPDGKISIFLFPED
ncbi:hypothetical protein [Burkholderia phage vB_BpP_HN05]